MGTVPEKATVLGVGDMYVSMLGTHGEDTERKGAQGNHQGASLRRGTKQDPYPHPVLEKRTLGP